jgi:DnaJ like chaperone protein
MAKYEKWLGASLGWMMTGNPLGGLLGFIAGSLIENGEKKVGGKVAEGISEFEMNLIVIASHLIKIDGKVSLHEITFLQQFLNAHFENKHSAKRKEIINHCLTKEYDLNIACDQIRMYTPHATHVQVIHFLFDLAISDGELHERESYFIFRLAGYINVNDVEFKRIKTEHLAIQTSAYEILGVRKEMSFAEIRTVYRQLVLKFHPDRNKEMDEEEKKKLTVKFQQIKDAYQNIKKEKEG